MKIQEHCRELNVGTAAKIEWLVNKMHVSERLSVVGRDIQARLRKNPAQYPLRPKGTPQRRLLAEAIRHARRTHEENRGEYRWVMGGH